MRLVDSFNRDGFVRVENAFGADIAAQCRELAWAQLPVDRTDRDTWTQPVHRIAFMADPPFVAAANTERLGAAFDAVVGAERWQPLRGLGSIPVRFPSATPPGDDGWHVDASFPGEDPNDYMSWRVNAASRGRALLCLFLLSDVGTEDAPTRIRLGSHRVVADLLAPYGAVGLPMMDISERAAELTTGSTVEFATGRAGDVYLCHPFLVHAAQAHHGTTPRFMAQPPLVPRDSHIVERMRNRATTTHTTDEPMDLSRGE